MQEYPVALPHRRFVPFPLIQIMFLIGQLRTVQCPQPTFWATATKQAWFSQIREFECVYLSSPIAIFADKKFTNISGDDNKNSRTELQPKNFKYSFSNAPFFCYRLSYQWDYLDILFFH